MLNAVRRYAALIAMGAAILVALWFVTSSRTFDACVSPPNKSETPQLHKAPPKRVENLVSTSTIYGRCLSVYVVKENAGITALSTLFLAGITVWLGIIAAGQHSTVRAQLRAYVGIATGSLERIPDQSKFAVTIKIRMKNFGQTPAHEVQCWVAVEAAEKFREALDRRQAVIGSKSALFPQGAQTVKFSRDLAEPPGNGGVGIFVFGHITYRDVFGNPWRTNFRFLADPRTGNLSSCDEGNEAT